ncbi:hypothetical protein EON66_05455 [archaeon]|nr:MAG: hypothetical protein EON66_05455 [archaeon]
MQANVTDISFRSSNHLWVTLQDGGDSLPAMVDDAWLQSFLGHAVADWLSILYSKSVDTKSQRLVARNQAKQLERFLLERAEHKLVMCLHPAANFSFSSSPATAHELVAVITNFT